MTIFISGTSHYEDFKSFVSNLSSKGDVFYSAVANVGFEIKFVSSDREVIIWFTDTSHISGIQPPGPPPPTTFFNDFPNAINLGTTDFGISGNDGALIMTTSDYSSFKALLSNFGGKFTVFASATSNVAGVSAVSAGLVARFTSSPPLPATLSMDFPGLISMTDVSSTNISVP